MALTEQKKAYFREYRKAHPEQTKAAQKKYQEENGTPRYYENIEITRAIKRKHYYTSVGQYVKADEEQQLIDQLRQEVPKKKPGRKPTMTPEEQKVNLKRIRLKSRYKVLHGQTDFRTPNKCEVCGSGVKVCLDHCHDSHSFRGWICDTCNIVLGRVKDDAGHLAALIVYLEKHKEKLKRNQLTA